LRAVSQVSGADGGVSRPKLTIEELEGVITPEVCPFPAVFVEKIQKDRRRRKRRKMADIRMVLLGGSFPNSSNSDSRPNWKV
jgi:hypothetical protein